MILCDIGNTSYHFLDAHREYRESVDSFNPALMIKKIYYISVNSKISKKLEHLDNWVDIASFVDMDQYYSTMGIDRIIACEAVASGIILDVGSAITVDIVKDNLFCGGFIYPGVAAMRQTYKNISPELDYSFNFECDLDIMPKNSMDAISYGFIKTLYSEVISHDIDIYITGGDADKFSKVFKDAKVEKLLIFNGMKKIIKKANLC